MTLTVWKIQKCFFFSNTFLRERKGEEKERQTERETVRDRQRSATSHTHPGQGLNPQHLGMCPEWELNPFWGTG